MSHDSDPSFGFTPFDPANYLLDDEDAMLYLQACVDEAAGDASYIAKALGDIARARGLMSDIATATGLSRESLYKALSGKRSPSFSTMLRVVAALGLKLQFVQFQPVGVPEPKVLIETVDQSSPKTTFASAQPQPTIRLDLGAGPFGDLRARKVRAGGIGTSSMDIFMEMQGSADNKFFRTSKGQALIGGSIAPLDYGDRLTAGEFGGLREGRLAAH